MGLLRIVLGLLAGFIALLFFRLLLGGRKKGAPRPAAKPVGDGRLVRCVTCGTAIPAERALPSGAPEGWACSEACRASVRAVAG